MKRALIATLALLAVATFAHAGRGDDFEFAQGLMDRKYYDLAKEQFEKIVNDSSRSGEEQAEGELGLALLLKAQAADARLDSKKTSEEVLEVFGQAEGRFDKFLGKFPNHSKRDFARFQVGSLLHNKGLYLRDQIEKDPENADRHRQGAEEALSAAIDLFKEAAELLEERAENDPTADWQARRTRFFELAANYDKGMIYPAGSAEREGMLSKTSRMCEDFNWENEDNILGGFAYMYWGLVHKGLDEPNRAMEYFITCADMPIPDPKVDGLASYRNWAGLFMQAYWKLGEYANELGTRDDVEYRDTALEQLENMMKRIPDCWEYQYGHLALLEYARALSGLGRFGEARDIVTQVSQKGDEIAPSQAWGAGTAFLANRLLNEIISDATVAGIKLKTAPDVLFKAAEGKRAARKWSEAVQSYQQVVSACTTQEEIDQFAVDAWMKIGECYYLGEKFFEAYFTYDRIERDFPKSEIAGDAAYYRYRAITARYGESKDPRDLELKKKARSDFAGKYKDHQRSIDLQYFEGADLILDGDTLRVKGKTLDAKKAYNDALTRLQNTKVSSILYSKAHARIGELLYKIGKPDDALKKFVTVRQFIGDKKNITTDPIRRANRKQALAITTYFEARSYKDLEKWDDVVKTLVGYEEEYSEDNVLNFHPPVKFERLRALIRLGRLAEAEVVAVKLQEDWPDASQIPLAFSMLSTAHNRAAKAALEAKDKDNWAKSLRKAAEFYGYYLEKRDLEEKPLTWQENQLLGYWYFDLADMAKAEPYLETALELLALAVDKAEGAEAARLTKQADGLLQKLSEILLKQKKFGEAKNRLEALLVPQEGARERVLKLLRDQEHSQAGLKELMQKMRPMASLMEGLARTYKHVGDPDDMLRGLTLMRLLERADPENKYTDIGWNRKLLRVELYLQFGRDFRNQDALNNAITLVNQWESLGVLANSPVKEELSRLRAEASRLLSK